MHMSIVSRPIYGTAHNSRMWMDTARIRRKQR